MTGAPTVPVSLEDVLRADGEFHRAEEIVDRVRSPSRSAVKTEMELISASLTGKVPASAEGGYGVAFTSPELTRRARGRRLLLMAAVEDDAVTLAGVVGTDCAEKRIAQSASANGASGVFMGSAGSRVVTAKRGQGSDGNGRGLFGAERGHGHFWIKRVVIFHPVMVS